MKKVVVVLVGLLVAASPAHAEISRMRASDKCPMQENVGVSINFNLHADSFADAKKKFDEKMKQVEDMAKQQNLKKFEQQSMNYSISGQNNGTGMEYQLNGSASYQLDSTDSAFKICELLSQQKFQVSMNSSSYRNGCNRNVEE